jgi:hypothetical protein
VLKAKTIGFFDIARLTTALALEWMAEAKRARETCEWGGNGQRERGQAVRWHRRIPTTKTPPKRGFVEAAEGIRTLDLLHGKQTL